ncbi:MAG: pyruvate dehydrogenase (acetyl-transferring) E1 component subunit alpha [Proteobacteria bacterium]|nr:pyruvate dehydrogenase (acetyl-transferring) E1 component subunit alpha [Pseudomonadota bacterium]
MSLQASSKAPDDYQADFLISLLQDMIFYRRFEERVLVAYTKMKFAGFCHLHIGQEGLCVGVQRAIDPQDYVITGYRSHTQAIAKGIPARDVLAELFGKVSGCSRGKGGSMHMFSREKRFYGGHGIVGGQVPIAVGMAWKIHYNEENHVVVCYLGDGAINQGQVYEAMNMACIWQLPVLFIIENNLYGMGTHIGRTTSVGAKTLYKRALAFDMAHSQVNGQNVLDVYQQVNKLVKGMREAPGPHLLEALTYRYKGHSVSDPSLYRTKEEIQGYMNHDDPIKNLSDKLIQDKIASKDDIKQWDKKVKATLKTLEASVDKDMDPELSEAYEHVYS